jgi:type II secretory pathway predicted ATPase ExeA
MRADFPPPPQQQQRPHALEDLLRAWGLHRTPFAPDEKSAQLFAASCHREALELLHTTAALRGLMLLTGPPGTGKSTLLKSWIASLEPKRFLPLLIPHSNLSATGVLEILLAKLGERPRCERENPQSLTTKRAAPKALMDLLPSLPLCC